MMEIDGNGDDTNVNVNEITELNPDDASLERAISDQADTIEMVSVDRA